MSDCEHKWNQHMDTGWIAGCDKCGESYEDHIGKLLARALPLLVEHTHDSEFLECYECGYLTTMHTPECPIGTLIAEILALGIEGE